ncbi:beta-ketoacyl-[acyl-carrier-protein] synthase family protein [Paenibacillus sp. ACRRX]|uniref:beta-ketoacyl-[acyl-carrier-protein] synthase family protein n=1 Tax=Paenibacillus sp. ACRRX TaxID=2918206 RepID=UPI001EF58901|nr:beta-ketoacyl-[acyl-carrier-protein] synthase family protein [Paenibacillus sp. ACRRX]MCG7408933.1 beta-ketoacyl-[acyl-carrier-protein] synthase family protein [Paenibacillus sp. ACRRX]
MDKSVVITGLGVITPFGKGIEAIRSHTFAGRHGFTDIESFSTALNHAKRGGELKVKDRTFRAFSRYCIDEALAMAGLDRMKDRELLKDAVVAIGNVGEGVSLESYYSAQYGRKTSGNSGLQAAVDDSFIRQRDPFRAAEEAAAYIGSTNVHIAFSNACVASANAIGYGYDQIRKGRASCALVGGIHILNPFVFNNFDSNRAMASGVVRPFSLERDGLLISDGAAMLLLETREHARQRQAKPLAELLGWGISADGFHVTQPHPEGNGLARAMQAALRSANLSPADIDYINAHGTGTPLNDRSETKAVKQVFGKEAYQIPVSSTKSTTGHMLEATGAVEAVIGILALMDQRIPPTANYGTPDPTLDLDYVTEGVRAAPLQIVMSNSSAFGGNNCSLILGRGKDE